MAATFYSGDIGPDGKVGLMYADPSGPVAIRMWPIDATFALNVDPAHYSVIPGPPPTTDLPTDLIVVADP